MLFANRQEAGELLTPEIKKLAIDPTSAIVAAIPRGGVVVADVICRQLAIPLAVLVIKKLGAPYNPELAIGAVASHGEAVLDRWLIRDLKVTSEWLKKEIKTKRREAQGREKFLQVELTGEKFKDKTVIVVDDGLATGQTARAAAKILKKFGAAKLILAVPCAPPSTVEAVEDEYDQVIVLSKSEEFMAVGQFYRDFRPVDDQEVKKLLDHDN